MARKDLLGVVENAIDNTVDTIIQGGDNVVKEITDGNVGKEIGRVFERIKDDPTRLFTYGLSMGGGGFGISDYMRYLSEGLGEITGVAAEDRRLEDQQNRAAAEAQAAKRDAEVIVQSQLQMTKNANAAVGTPTIVLGTKSSMLRAKTNVSKGLGLDEQEASGLGSTGIQLN